MPRLGVSLGLSHVLTREAPVLIVDDFAFKSYKAGELSFPLAGVVTQDIKYSNVFNIGWEKHSDGNIAIGAAGGSVEDPFSGTNAWKLTYSRTGYSFFRQAASAAADSTFSIYIKKVDHRYIGIRNHETSSAHSVFDFDTESFVRTQGDHVLSFEKIGLTGWYRIFDYHPTGVEGNVYQGIAITDVNGNESTPSGMPASGDVSVYIYGANSSVGPEAMAYLDRPDATAVSRTFDLSDIDNNTWEASFDLETGLTEYTPVEQSSIDSEGYWNVINDIILNKDATVDLVDGGLLANGNFNDGDSSWELNPASGTVEVIDRKLVFTGATSTGTQVQQKSVGISTGNWYKLSFTISDYVSGTFRMSVGNQICDAVSANGEYEFYVKYENGLARSYLYSGNSTLKVDNIEIQRVGVNWSIGDGWEHNGSLFTCVSGNNNLATVGASLIAGYAYSVSVNVTRTSGTLSVDLGGASAQTTTTSGVQTFNFTAVNTDQLRFYGGSFRGTIDDIKVTERNRDITTVDGI